MFKNPEKPIVYISVTGTNCRVPVYKVRYFAILDNLLKQNGYIVIEPKKTSDGLVITYMHKKDV